MIYRRVIAVTLIVFVVLSISCTGLSKPAFALDGTAPELQSATLDGSVVTLAYNEALDEGSVPDPGNFYVTAGGQEAEATAVAVTGSEVEVTLAEAPQATGSLLITFLQGNPPLRDLAGNAAGNLIDRAIAQADNVPPTLLSAIVSGARLSLQFNELLDPGSVPPAGSFVVKVNGTVTAASAVAVSGAELVLTLAQPATAGQSVRVTYLSGSPALQDIAGNKAANLHDAAVLNPVQTAGPQFVSAVINGKTIQVTFNQNLNTVSIPSRNSFFAVVDALPAPVAAVAVAGPVATLTLSAAVSSSQSVTIGYVPPAISPLLGSTGVKAEGFDNRAVSNRTDSSPPLLQAARISADTIRLVYSEKLQSASLPDPNFYSVMVDGGYSPVDDVTIADATVTLRLSTAPSAYSTVTVSYSAPSVNGVQDLSGNAADNLVLQAVASGSDSTAPELVRAMLAGKTLTLTYNEPLSAASVPAAGSFIIASGAAPLTVAGVTVSGKEVRVELSAAPGSGASVTMTYMQSGSNGLMDLNGNAAASVYSWTVGSADDTAAPVLSTMLINGSTIRLTYGETLRQAAVPPTSAFYVTVNGVQRNVTNIAINDKIATLTIASSAGYSDTVVLTYIPPSDSNALQDNSGNPAAAISSQRVNNQTDVTPPVLLNANAAYSLITLLYGEALDPASVPPAGSFSIYGGGSTQVTTVTISGSMVMLALAAPVTQNGSLTISYSAPYGDGIQDMSGNKAASLYNQQIGGVNGNGNDYTPPTLSNAAVSGSTLTLTYNESLSSGSVPSASQFTLSSDGTSLPVNSVSVNGSTVTLNLQRPPVAGQTLRLNYSPYGGNSLKDANGNQVAALSDYSVTVPSTSIDVTGIEGNGSTITITVSRTLSDGSAPAASDFSLTVNNAVRQIRNVQINGYTVTLTLQGTVGSAGAQLSYTPGENPLQDSQGNRVEAFSNRMVTIAAPVEEEKAPDDTVTQPASSEERIDAALSASDAEHTTETTEQGETMDVYKLRNDSLAAALQKNNGGSVFTIQFSPGSGSGSNIVKLLAPVSAMTQATKVGGIQLILSTDAGEYDFPLATIDAASLAAGLKSGTGELNIGIMIRTADSALTERVTSAAKAAELDSLGSPVIYDTFVEADGKTYPLDTFNQYMKRKLYIGTEIEPKETTVVRYDPNSGELSYAPALLSGGTGRTTALIKHMTNGVYMAVRTHKQFADMKDHWAQGDVQLLASKLIVNGVSATEFSPNKSMTKAEFVALLTRSLGLYGTEEQLPYADVPANSWFAPAVATAYSAGIIDMADQFKPGEPISRAEIAIMTVRAVEAAGDKIPLTNIDQPLIDKYTDLGSISPEERSAIVANVKIGLMSGNSQTAFAPSDSATRAQAAVILGRLMRYEGLLDKDK